MKRIFFLEESGLFEFLRYSQDALAENLNKKTLLSPFQGAIFRISPKGGTVYNAGECKNFQESMEWY